MVDLDADVTVPEKGNLIANVAGNMKMIGDDIYASLTELKLDGDFEGLEGANAMLPIFVGPYMDETVQFPMDKFMEIAEQANAQSGQPTPNIEGLKAYGAEQMPKDLAESKILVVSKDNGVKKIKNISGDSVQAYHYEIEIDAKGFETFMRKYNENTKLFPEADLEKMLQEEGEMMQDVANGINEALTMQVWIGQADYQVYKLEVKTDGGKIATALEKVLTPEQKTMIDTKALSEGKLDVSLIVESQPLKSFSLTKPTGDDIIDLGPMIEKFAESALNPTFPSTDLPSDTTLTPPTGTTMSEEDVQKLMESLNQQQTTPTTPTPQAANPQVAPAQ